jgi:predicted dehydrogenase
MTTLTAGVVGFGERGMTLVKIIHEHVQRMQVIATADPDQKRREIAVNDFHLAPFESAEAMFAGLPHLDVAIVASNPPLHCSHVLLAAKHKCHIFCEKPLALSPTEADKMVVAVRNAGVVCTVDFETIFADSFLILKKELKRDGFGKLYRFIATDKGRPPAYDIETCMPHFLHTMIMLTGSRPIEVYGNVIINEHKATFEDIVHISDLYPQGRSHDIGLRADTMEVSYLFGNGVKANFFLAQLDEDYVVEAGISSKKPGSEFMNFVAHGTRGQVKFHQTATGYVLGAGL